MEGLPNLNALRAFAAAGRHLSVTKAAQELHVTPGAVSQLVRSLEDQLGVRLFQRVHRGLLLTDAGQRYYADVERAFRLLLEGTDRLTQTAALTVLTVSVAPSFAALWLMPRLPRFHQRHAGIEVHIRTATGAVDFVRERVDLAIRIGVGPMPGLVCDRVLDLEMLPVANPHLLRKHGMPKEPGDMSQWPLLYDPGWDDWTLWFDAHGLGRHLLPRGPEFDNASLLLRATLDGQGAALIPRAFAEAELAEKRLVQLFEQPWPSTFAYYCLCPRTMAEEPRVAAFRRWLVEEGGGKGSSAQSKTRPPGRRAAPTARTRATVTKPASKPSRGRTRSSPGR